jgi:hypothetical protein
MMRVEKMARRARITVIDHTAEFEAERKSGVAVYSPLHEHHPSADAFFPVVLKLLGKIARLSHVSVKLPENFPRVVSREISVNRIIDTNYDVGTEFWAAEASRYRSAHYVNTNYSKTRPWTAVTFPRAEKDQPQFEYMGGGPLPPTAVWGDSFFGTYATQFGEMFLPYFKEIKLWALQSGVDVFIREWNASEVIVLSFADQNAGSYLPFLEDVVARDRANSSP